MDNIILRCDNNINGILLLYMMLLYTKIKCKKKITKYTGTIFLLR